MTPKNNPPTVWVVELEEDPLTGDLVMPIPQALLESLGWSIGDTLVWGTDPAGQEVTLQRKT
jgi:hypothetical protein